ncbi:MAG: sigma-70 family RNA polymerase sigma factor [Thiolinea sp.]
MNVTLQQMDENLLIERCKTELPYTMDGYAELVRRYEHYVFNLCRRYLGSAEDAEDTTQEVFMRVFHALPGFEGRAQFKTWLFRVAMNQCHTTAARRHPETYSGENEHGESIVDTLADDSSPHENYAAEDERDCVQKTLQSMRPAETEVLSLRFMGELSLEEIAETLGTRLSATKMRFYRAMEQFKHLYERLCL